MPHVLGIKTIQLALALSILLSAFGLGNPAKALPPRLKDGETSPRLKDGETSPRLKDGETSQGDTDSLGANAEWRQTALDPSPSAEGEYAPGQVWVRVEGSEDPSCILAAAAGTPSPERWRAPLLREGVPNSASLDGGTPRQARIIAQIPSLRATLLQVEAGTERDVIAQLRRDPRVEYAELNYHARMVALPPATARLNTPDDPRWPDQWALPRIGAPEAWDITHSQDIVVALLDTGTYLEHPDLQGVFWTNQGEIPDNGKDDDGNGKIDDVHGWHFYQSCGSAMCEPYEDRFLTDENGHGTHVTGILAARTNNGIGVAGLSRGARPMIVKVLDRYGNGYYSDIAAAVVYATDNGARIINLSLGGEEPSSLLQEAVDYAYERGVLLVAAAGNEGGPVLYPAACDHVMAVAASNWTDQRADFSNYGSQLDIAAPGDSILSTWLSPHLYFYKRGTSMAAPHVSGAAALLWSWRPDFSNSQIEERLESTAEDVNAADHPGWDPYLGWGRLNVYRALAGLPPGPTPTPTSTPTATTTPTPSRHVLRLILIFKGFHSSP